MTDVKFIYLFIFLCDTFPKLCLQQDVKRIYYFDKTNKIIIGHFCTTYIFFSLCDTCSYCVVNVKRIVSWQDE